MKIPVALINLLTSSFQLLLLRFAAAAAECEMDAVVVGAGPVGLFFALQLKYRIGMSTLMLEKYEEYQRKHVLNIELASFATATILLSTVSIIGNVAFH